MALLMVLKVKIRLNFQSYPTVPTVLPYVTTLLKTVTHVDIRIFYIATSFNPLKNCIFMQYTGIEIIQHKL